MFFGWFPVHKLSQASIPLRCVPFQLKGCPSWGGLLISSTGLSILHRHCRAKFPWGGTSALQSQTEIKPHHFQSIILVTDKESFARATYPISFFSLLFWRVNGWGGELHPDFHLSMHKVFSYALWCVQGEQAKGMTTRLQALLSQKAFPHIYSFSVYSSLQYDKRPFWSWLINREEKGIYMLTG